MIILQMQQAREKRGRIKAANWTLKIKQYDKRIEKDPC